MEIKEIPEITMLTYSERVTYKTMMHLVRNKARELYREAGALDLEVTGPIYWTYNGVDGNPDTEFTLEISLPISATTIVSTTFEIKRFPAFKAASMTHYGNWGEMAKSYGMIIEDVFKNSLQLSGVNREVYLNMDFDTADNNITEIQVGIQ